MYVISVINYKGGVGKTTITANLSAELAYRGFNVLMIDLDPTSPFRLSDLKHGLLSIPSLEPLKVGLNPLGMEKFRI
ncbi:AAA family ATPase [Desulfococcaceae bacterium HSG8]|nr:AAA family ATPase [Desulfococcaceae bacterium HSG8]